jgi:glycosyltransferase involved in cell wall biosynthesis
MKICLVTAFPPSHERLNEYGFHLASELQRHPFVSLTVLGDEYGGGKPELPDFDVVRCWRPDTLRAPVKILNAVRDINPDIVWFNLVFSSFGTNPFAAFTGLMAPSMLRSAGYFTHTTLHHLMENINLDDAGIHHRSLYRIAGAVATHMLLMSNSTTVLLPAYRRTLLEKYHGKNVHLRAHGIFSAEPQFPDFSLRNNPERRILAFGKWGTYKKVDLLVEAYDGIASRVPNCKLIIAGENHPAAPGYVESIAERCKGRPDVDIIGYVPEERIPDLFRSSSVLVMPYTSAGGSSGVAHQACQFGLPIVCADINDFREMAHEEGIAIDFYQPGDAQGLAGALVDLLNDEERQLEMSEQNFYSAMRLTMPQIIYQYLRAFDWEHRARGVRQRVRQLRWSLATRGALGINLSGLPLFGNSSAGTATAAPAPTPAPHSLSFDDQLSRFEDKPVLPSREPLVLSREPLPVDPFRPRYTIVLPSEPSDFEAVLRMIRRVAAQFRWNAELLLIGENACRRLESNHSDGGANSQRQLPIRAVDAGAEYPTIRHAFHAGNGDLFVFLKSSGVQARELKKVVAAIEQGADVAIGSPYRSAPGALRRGEQWMARQTLRLAMPLESPALACTRRAGETIFSVHRTMNGAGEMEMVYLARKFGLLVKEVQMPWSSDACPSQSGCLKHALQIRWNELMGSYRTKSLACVRGETERAA